MVAEVFSRMKDIISMAICQNQIKECTFKAEGERSKKHVYLRNKDQIQ